MSHRTVPGLPDAGKLHPYDHRPREDDLVVDLVRPQDLVALTVTVRGATLEPPADPGAEGAHAVVVAGPDATLVVDLPFQHAHEEASYEASAAPQPDPMHPDRTPPAPPATTVVLAAGRPARYRPARGSRLVFRLPEGGRIPHTTAGILGALPWLDAVLHPRGAAPGRRPAPYQLPSGRLRLDPALELPLPGGVFAVLGAEGVTIMRRGSAGTVVPDENTVRGRTALAANDRLVAGYARTHGIRLVRGLDRAVLGGRVGELLDPSARGLGVFRRGTYSRRANPDETSIEAPFRLQVSPTSEGHWVHAATPVTAGDATGHVELWHTRLDTGARTEADLLRPGRPADAETRVVRAVWARDRDDHPVSVWRDPGADDADTKPLGPDTVTSAGASADPFLGSLDRADRHRLVRQTAEVWPGSGRRRIDPVPVGADRLWLTALGAWLDLHGHWDTQPYSEQGIASVLAWDHVATAGRDQYVRVVYPGYLFPLGQPTVRVKLTQRSIRPQADPRAGLVQRQFLVVIDPHRDHTAVHGLPWTSTRIAPGATPALDPPGDDTIPGLTASQAFWPRVVGQTFSWRVDGVDRDGRPQSQPVPMVWVAEHVRAAADLRALEKGYAQDARRIIDLGGQHVAFAPAGHEGDSRVETRTLRLLGTARQGGSTPRMSTADVVLPAAQAVAGTGATRITYFPEYRTRGFTPGNAGRVWASTLLPGLDSTAEYRDDLATTGPALDEPQELPRIGFGGAPGDTGSDRAGGFVQPNLTVAGLSQVRGPVGDLASVAAGTFDPAAFLGDALPKLFGLVELVDLLPATGPLAQAPALVTEALDTFSAIESEVQRAVAVAQDAAGSAAAVRDRVQGSGGAALAEAQALLDDAEALATAFADLLVFVGGLPAALAGLDTGFVASALDAPSGLKQRLTVAATAARALSRAPLPMMPRSRLTQTADALTRLAASADLLADVVGVLQGVDLERKEISFRFEWTPTLESWPKGEAPLVRLAPDSLVIALAGTLRASAAPSVEVLAELRDFSLILFASEPLVTIPFERLGFHGGTSGKAEVDVVMGDIVFGGFLSFVETIKDLIPLDGFSDPPSVEVTPQGLTAGFSLTLPNLAVGVFNLSNMSLGADVRVPFLGETISFGFNFCTRERPFVLSVVFLGGGGWFLIRLSPKGLEVLELGLEAGAYLAVDFGVASGSISAAIGIYIRLEGEKGSLTGYFRLRGEVDVLGLISASIELSMELVYSFTTGKMIGRARITVEVEVLCFSASVSIEAERQLAGSNGDPSLRDVVLEADGTAPAWDDYLLAFATEEVPA
ncbi:hypothetical protein [Arthrobacter sp. NEB 688]|uniref:hypothetical protein n=1 Tax=Arthrobacter sp. NEB 688 TaxID=904039 RepID=UPI001563521B|nr:hypothetical protein [Arthrobacter sp. NEB 688]QKE84417.1 hypothetical protein HL663_11040 [Arthrobacter sp. NEB 688]